MRTVAVPVINPGALAVTTTIYLLVQGVAQGLLGPSMSGFAAAPLAEAASRVLGRDLNILLHRAAEYTDPAPELMSNVEYNLQPMER